MRPGTRSTPPAPPRAEPAPARWYRWWSGLALGLGVLIVAYLGSADATPVRIVPVAVAGMNSFTDPDVIGEDPASAESGELAPATPVSRPSPVPSTSPGSHPAPQQPVPAAAAQPVPAVAVRVRYEIAGQSLAGLVNYTTGQSSPVAEARQVRLPWRMEFDASGGFVPSLSVQSAGAGSITCRITVNGEELSSVTVEGTNAVVICTGRALN